MCYQLSERLLEKVCRLSELGKQVEILIQEEQFCIVAILDEMKEIIDIKKVPFFFVSSCQKDAVLEEGEYFVITHSSLDNVGRIDAHHLGAYLVMKDPKVGELPIPEDTRFLSTKNPDDIYIFLAKFPEYIKQFLKE